MNPEQTTDRAYRAKNLVIGGGIAGIVTALELLDGGQDVVLLDADTPERFGGLALWAFGGMALIFIGLIAIDGRLLIRRHGERRAAP